MAISPPTGQSRPQIDWNELLDGRPRRFKRGKHYVGTADAVVREAKMAAEALDKAAVTVKDQIGKYEHVWVQFLDGKIEVGKPCPRCGNTSLEKVQEYFARCPACDSLHALVEARSDGPEPGDVAEMVEVRLLSGGGSDIQRLSLLDDAVIEVTYTFFLPVNSAEAQITFFAGPRKVLKTSCPETIGVHSAPQTVKFSLRVDPRVLLPGEYSVHCSLHMVVERTRLLKLNIADALAVEVFDPGSEAYDEPAGDGRPHIHWTIQELSPSPGGIVRDD